LQTVEIPKKTLGTGGPDDSIGNMKARCAPNPTRGFTWVELLVVIGVLALVAALLLPALAAAKRKSARIGCVSSLKQIGIAFRMWEGDNGDKYPMQFALTNSETMKLLGNGNAYILWQAMSNELSTPKILHCPQDKQRTNAVSFSQGFSDANISYFFSLDAFESYPQMILVGDDNLIVDGVRVKPGILNLWTNNIAWTKERHGGSGNIGMADGSVQQTTSAGLNSAVVSSTSGVPTNNVPNRWVIP
jgi:prepilin-type processing-associated H-X9-DG protein/prepilin-type N-terminal cleavage/methylation domain-containing protein